MTDTSPRPAPRDPVPAPWADVLDRVARQIAPWPDPEQAPSAIAEALGPNPPRIRNP